MLVEPASQFAPPVVAVMVVHDPGDWFDEVLAGLATQDYPNLKHLVLLAGDAAELPERIRAGLSKAFVRAVEGNPGFGPAANEVLRLVDGDNGFFCFLHDDVALRPDAVRLLVEEVYRSNAGVVGPKLLDWDEARVLQHVGFAVDRFGEIDPIVEPGETDQEQHDAVRDVFALPSACLLVRADLFRSLGGFDDEMSFHGEDVDLCWRAHLSGARVLVVPASEGRHRERLVERRPDLAHETLRARHRMRSVATLTGARRLPLVMIELLMMSILQFAVGLATGRAAHGWAGVRSLVGLLPRTPAVVARRRSLAAGRLVPDREVVGLQVRGSARLSAHLRSRDNRPDVGRTAGRAWRERAGASAVVAWCCIVIAVVAGARHLITDGVPAFGEFLPFDDSPLAMLRSAASSWNAAGVGADSPPPTGLALIAIASVATAFHMGLLHTLSVVGLLVVGALGMWRLTTAFGLVRARIASTVIFVAIPLSSQLLSVGRWGALLVGAALPWSIDAIRRGAGIVPGPADESGERTVVAGARQRLRVLAGGGLVCAVVTAFEPSYLMMVLVVGVVVAAATLLTGARAMAAVDMLVATVAAVTTGFVLNLPWLTTYLTDGGWGAIVGPVPPGDRGNSVVELLSFDLGNVRGAVLSIALYVTVVAAMMIGRGWRFGWAVRGGALAVAFGWLAVLDDGGSLPIRLPEPGIVLAPVAVGLALCAGCVVASLELDVRGGSFGWRQPLALLGMAAIVVGALPSVFAVSSGRFDAPRTTLIDLLGQLPDEDDGAYRVLWVGDHRVLPVAAATLRPGVTYAVTDGPDLDVADTWATPPAADPPEIAEALDAIAFGSTTRAGRLLAPWAVRYVIVPIVDGAVSTPSAPIPVPGGLLDALGDQLDLAEVYSPPSFAVFENRAWVPTRSILTPVGAEASRKAGAAALAQSDLAGASPVMTDGDHLSASTVDAAAGTLHLAVPFDRSWELRVGGDAVAPRPAFGATMAFDLASPGTVTLAHRSGAVRTIVLVLQAMAWGGACLAASSLRWRRRERRVRTVPPAADAVLVLHPMLMPEPVAELEPVAAAAAIDLEPEPEPEPESGSESGLGPQVAPVPGPPDQSDQSDGVGS